VVEAVSPERLIAEEGPNDLRGACAEGRRDRANAAVVYRYRHTRQQPVVRSPGLRNLRTAVGGTRE
jgi:hypothetical protein